MNSVPDPKRVQTGLALAQAQFELANLRRRLRLERWVSIVLSGAALVLGFLPCAG